MQAASSLPLGRCFHAALALTAILFSGCGGSGVKDGPPPGFPVLGHVPDAIPKAEPRSRYGNPSSYVVLGKRYHTLDSSRGYVERGIASWYGRKFHGRRTSSGEPFNMYAMTAAHKSLPLPTYVLVTNRANGRQAVVKVNDRGPFVDDRLIDLSYAAAAKLGVLAAGTAEVEVRALREGEPIPESARAPVRVGDGSIYLQLGAFQQRANAEMLRAQLSGADVRAAFVDQGRDPRGARVYRVRVGPLDDQRDVDTVVGKLRRAGISRYRLVTE